MFSVLGVGLDFFYTDNTVWRALYLYTKKCTIKRIFHSSFAKFYTQPIMNAVIYCCTININTCQPWIKGCVIQIRWKQSLIHCLWSSACGYSRVLTLIFGNGTLQDGMNKTQSTPYLRILASVLTSVKIAQYRASNMSLQSLLSLLFQESPWIWQQLYCFGSRNFFHPILCLETRLIFKIELKRVRSN